LPEDLSRWPGDVRIERYPVVTEDDPADSLKVIALAKVGLLIFTF
jgi:hypothetical protein